MDPVHLAIIHTGTEVLAVDLLTRNGTLLNGLKMQYEALRDGDRLTIGPWDFTVRIEQPRASPDADLHPFDLEPTPQVIALEHLATRRILKPGREACLIGRRNGCDILVQDNGASRVHAILFTYHGYPAICDLLSRNPTQVNHAPVTFQVLRNEDIITIGETRFRVRLHTSSVQESRLASRTSPGAPGPVSAGTSTPKSAPARSITPAVPPEPDLIDIAKTEGSQRWSIADSVERPAGKAPV